MSEITAEMIERKHGAEADALRRRRQLQRDVREAREQLTSTSGLNRAFDDALARQFARSHVGAAPALMVFSLLVGGSIASAAGVLPVFLWFCLVVSTTALVSSVCQRFLRTSADGARIERWRLIFICLKAVHGIAWASIVVLVTDVHSETTGLIVVFALLLLGAIDTMISATVPAAAYAGLVPIGIAIVLAFSNRTDLNFSTVLVISTVAQGLFVLLTRRLYEGAVGSNRSRAEKDLLIAELEEQRSKSDDSRRRAEEANLAKSRFLATMSHELRTPLNAILGFSEVMKNEVFGPHAMPAYKEYATDIHASGQHLLDVINEILDLSRVEAGRYELQEEAVDLVGVADDCVHMLEMRARNRNLTVRTIFEQSLPKVWADERALRQVVLNLLSNALKFTPAGGEVSVKVGWTAGGGQYLLIKDNGPGIPEEEIPVVLSTFGRGSSAIKHAQEGAGLGLPIVQSLIELHAGTFHLTSKLREGTEVVVTLPPERVMEALAPMEEPEIATG